MRPMLPEAIATVAEKQGITPTIVPTYAGDRAAVMRAISIERTRIARQGWLLRGITQTHTRLVYGIVKETVEQDIKKVTLDHLDCLEWDKEVSNGSYIAGTHAFAQDTDQFYQDLRGKIVGADWTDTLTAYLTNTCYAQPMREDGRVYWVPPQAVDLIDKLQTFLDVIGIAVVACRVETNQRTVIQQAATETLAEQLAHLQ